MHRVTQPASTMRSAEPVHVAPGQGLRTTAWDGEPRYWRACRCCGFVEECSRDALASWPERCADCHDGHPDPAADDPSLRPERNGDAAKDPT
jgi:hypothetical protein